MSYRRISGSINAATLRDQICRLNSSKELSLASIHLRNWGMASNIALIGRLGGHQNIIGKLDVKIVPQMHQFISGTRSNQYAHTGQRILINEKAFEEYFKSKEGQKEVLRLQSLGVKAPSDWQQTGDFSLRPVQNDIDSLLEGKIFNEKLCGLTLSVVAATSDNYTYNGSGVWTSNIEKLKKNTKGIYYDIWIPGLDKELIVASGVAEAKLSLAGRKGDDYNIERNSEIIESIKNMRQKLKQNFDSDEVVDRMVHMTKNESWIE